MEEVKLRLSRRKEIMKIRVEVNKRENRPKIEKINKTKISFFEKINKINRLLARLRKERDRYQLQYQE